MESSDSPRREPGQPADEPGRIQADAAVDLLLDVPIVLPPLVVGLSLLILFGFSTALLWNGGREPQPGGQPA